jgi:NADH dehydrogenase
VGIISEAGTITFERLHVDGTRNLVAAAQTDGVRRFVHMSALGTRAQARSRYHQTKWEAEEIVRQSGLNYTILRPSLIYGPEDHFVNQFLSLSRWLPFLPVMGPGNCRMQPVGVEDVARCFVQALQKPESEGQVYEVCGPDPLTFMQILDAILKAADRRRLKVHIPMPLARLQAAVLEMVLGTFLGTPPPLNRDQLLMLQEDNVGDSEPAARLFELRQESFEGGIRRYANRKQHGPGPKTSG